MERILPAAILVSCVTFLLVACVAPASVPTVVSKPPALSPTTAASQPSPAAKDMPTAMPLWTATPKPLPSPTLSKPTQATPGQATALPSAAPGVKDALDPSVAALVNGVVVSKAEYDMRVAQAQVYLLKQPGFDVKTEEGRRELVRFRERVLDWLIDQVLIEQQAAAQGIIISEARVEAEVARMRGQNPTRFNKWLAANGLTMDTLREQVRTDLITTAMRDKVTASVPRRVEQFHVRHILLSEESAAQNVWQQIKQGQNFIVMARRFSEDATTRDGGGDLGFLARGVMPPAFEKAAFALKPGEISGVVRSESGYHIIQLVEIDPERLVTNKIWPVVQQRAFEDWLAEQRARAEIQRAAESSSE